MHLIFCPGPEARVNPFSLADRKQIIADCKVDEGMDTLSVAHISLIF